MRLYKHDQKVSKKEMRKLLQLNVARGRGRIKPDATARRERDAKRAGLNWAEAMEDFGLASPGFAQALKQTWGKVDCTNLKSIPSMFDRLLASRPVDKLAAIVTGPGPKE
jgi:hypothetical protein